MTKYVNNNGVSEMWTNTKNYISAQLLGKSDVGHTHSASEITDLPSGYVVDSALSSSSENPVQNKVINSALDGYVPRSGGAVITGWKLAKTVNNGEFLLCGGIEWNTGSFIALHGQNHNDGGLAIIGAGGHRMNMYPSGGWTWTGQAVQLVSDQRLKQQITKIDDELLDAWEDVDLVQFKYNEAVEEKGDNARLHTGYVVQQIDEACKKHNVDVSKYGLYCHEEYAEETREVERKDGIKTVEVVRPANEHYSLRYTEALIVECAYLRKCIKELRNEIEQLKSSK